MSTLIHLYDFSYKWVYVQSNYNAASSSSSGGGGGGSVGGSCSGNSSMRSRRSSGGSGSVIFSYKIHMLSIQVS